MSSSQKSMASAVLLLIFIGGLYALNIKSNKSHISETDIIEAINLSTSLKTAIAEFYAQYGYFPSDNEEAGLPPADSIFTKSIKRISVLSGGIIRADFTGGLENSSILIRPLPPSNSSFGHISWICLTENISGKVVANVGGVCKYSEFTKEKALMRAIERRSLDEISRLVATQVDLNAFAYGDTPLILSVRKGYAPIVREVVEQGLKLDENFLSFQGREALILAVRKNHTEIVRYLLGYGIDIHFKDKHGKSALDYAKNNAAKGIDGGKKSLTILSETNNEGLAKMTGNDSKYQIEISKYDGIISAVSACDGEKVEHILNEDGVDLNSDTVIAGKAPFLDAIKSGCVSVVKKFLDNDKFGFKSSQLFLFEAAKYVSDGELVDMFEALIEHVSETEIIGYQEILALLIKSDKVNAAEYIFERVDYKNSEYGNNNHLVEACKKGHVRLALRMIAVGVGISHIDVNGNTPITIAARNGHEEIVSRLLQAGADVNTKNYLGRTPLMEATQKRHKKIVELLLEKGADQFIFDGRGVDALSIAKSKRYAEIEHILRVARSNIGRR